MFQLSGLYCMPSDEFCIHGSRGLMFLRACEQGGTCPASCRLIPYPVFRVHTCIVAGSQEPIKGYGMSLRVGPSRMRARGSKRGCTVLALSALR